MPKSSILIDLDDPRTEEIAEAISNKTSKSILGIIAEQEMTETEIAEKLKIPLNTIDYNVKKLENAGLIEKAKTFSWSQKGKAVYKYKVSNKKIIISPKSLSKGVIPAFFITLFIALGLKIFSEYQQTSDLAESSPASTAGIMQKAAAASSPIPLFVLNQSWLWFLLGGIIALAVFLFWSRKLKPS